MIRKDQTTTMKSRTLLLALLSCVVPLAVAAPPQVPGPLPKEGGVEKFDPSRDAAMDIRDAVALAHRTGKHVLLDVGGEWCVWCRRLDSLFVSHPDLENFRAAHYVTVKVNWSKENKNEEVLARYPAVKGYPHLFVLDADGTLLHSQDTGALEKGKGHDPEKVMAFLKQWAPAGGTGRNP
jgi:thiol:disulfide interchange protein